MASENEGSIVAQNEAAQERVRSLGLWSSIFKESYQNDYLEFFAQYDGPINVEYRDQSS